MIKHTPHSQDVLDEAQGYIKNDQVTLEISVKADAPKNMMLVQV